MSVIPLTSREVNGGQIAYVIPPERLSPADRDEIQLQDHVYDAACVITHYNKSATEIEIVPSASLYKEIEIDQPFDAQDLMPIAQGATGNRSELKLFYRRNLRGLCYVDVGRVYKVPLACLARYDGQLPAYHNLLQDDAFNLIREAFKHLKEAKLKLQEEDVQERRIYWLKGFGKLDPEHQEYLKGHPMHSLAPQSTHGMPAIACGTLERGEVQVCLIESADQVWPPAGQKWSQWLDQNAWRHVTLMNGVALKRSGYIFAPLEGKDIRVKVKFEMLELYDRRAPPCRFQMEEADWYGFWYWKDLIAAEHVSHVQKKQADMNEDAGCHYFDGFSCDKELNPKET